MAKRASDLIDVGAYGAEHDCLTDPREDEKGDLGDWEWCWLLWCIVSLDAEKWALLVVVFVRYCRGPH